MKVACFADDAKEPELIGEVTVPIDEVLKLGEVDGESPSRLDSGEDADGRMVRILIQGQIQRGSVS